MAVLSGMTPELAVALDALRQAGVPEEVVRWVEVPGTVRKSLHLMTVDDMGECHECRVHRGFESSKAADSHTRGCGIGKLLYALCPSEIAADIARDHEDALRMDLARWGPHEEPATDMNTVFKRAYRNVPEENMVYADNPFLRMVPRRK